MHELRRFIEQEMARKQMHRPVDLVKASGLSKQLVGSLLSDTRDRLGEMPEPKTIEGLARAFSVPADAVRVVAAQALGIQVNSPVLVASARDVSDEDLLRELSTRLRDCAPVIRPLDIADLNEAGPGQLIDLMEDLRSEAARSDAKGLPFRALAERHLADYLDELFARARRERPTRDS